MFRELEEALEEAMEAREVSSPVLLPSDGCPGPAVVDLSPLLRLIVLNTQWCLHPYDIPEAPASDCSSRTRSVCPKMFLRP